MTDADRHLMTLFSAALDHEAGRSREAYLDRACTDPALRARVEALLRAHEQGGRFLEPTVVRARPGVEPPVGTGAWENTQIETGTVIAGRYKLLEEIGAGGMGAVWMAEQTQPVQRRVAVKLIKAGMDSRQVVARFEAERQALALMDHPNIAKVLDGGATDDGRPFFVMELVKGIPLTKYCDEKKLPVRERLALFADVCRAVQHAHQKGIIHRDLKPGNVLVAPYDGRPVVKVIDFGIAKATGRKLTEATLFTGFGAVVGTPEYMSPEQAELNNADIDTRSDVYALGVILYELLTGTTPLTRKRVREAALLEVLRLVREEEPPRPSTRLSSTDELPAIAAVRGVEPARLSRLVRGELDWIVMKALEKDRDRRYETATGLAADVQRYLTDEPVLACPPSTGYRLRKFARRNRGALAVAALVLFFLVVLGSGIGWAVRDRAAREERVEREKQEREAEVARDRAAREAEVARERLERETALDKEGERLLDEAEGLLARGDWPESQERVDRVDRLMASAGRAGRLARLPALRTDLTLARRAGEILREPQAPRGPQPQPPAAGNLAAVRQQDDAFGTTFREFGIDVDALSPADAAARVVGTRVRAALVRALDEWAAVRKQARGDDDPGWKKLVEVARRADGDDWRNRFRVALLALDRPALEGLADAVPVRDVPPATLHLLGSALQEVGALERAMDVLYRGRAQYPDDPWLNDILGLFSLSVCYPPRADDAVRFYTAASALRPGSPHRHRGLALALVALAGQGRKGSEGAYAAALAEYTRVTELTPRDARAWYERGEMYRMYLRDGDKAIADYERAIGADPDFAPARLALANQLLQKVRFRPQIDPRSLGLYGRCWHYAGELVRTDRLHRAVGELLEVVVRLKREIGEYSLRESLLLLKERGELGDLVARYRERIRLNPDDATARAGLGIFLEVDGQRDAAVAEYREALRRKNDSGVHSRLWNALVGEGRLDEAIDEARRAVLLYPDRAWGHFGLGTALAREAHLEVARATFAGGGFAGGFAAAATYAARKDRLNEAVASYRRGIRLETGYVPGVQFGFAAILKTSGQLGDALGLYLEAERVFQLQRRPDSITHAGYEPDVGWAIEKLEELPAVRALLNRPLAIRQGKDRPRDAADCLLLARFCQLKLSQDYGNALEFFKQAFALEPALADDLEVGNRYTAAAVAVQLAEGRIGETRPKKTPAQLRQQALAWLRADLDARTRLADEAPPWVAGTLYIWRRDLELAGVRDPQRLRFLPAAEQKEWQKFWDDVAAAISRAEKARQKQSAPK